MRAFVYAFEGQLSSTAGDLLFFFSLLCVVTQSKTLAFPIICHKQKPSHKSQCCPSHFLLTVWRTMCQKQYCGQKKKNIFWWFVIKTKFMVGCSVGSLMGSKVFLQGSSSLCCKNLCLNELFVVSPPLASITTKIICLHGWGLAHVQLHADRRTEGWRTSNRQRVPH